MNRKPKNQFAPRNPEVQEIIFAQMDALANMTSAQEVTVFLEDRNAEGDTYREQRRELIHRLDFITEQEEGIDHLVDAAHAKLKALQDSSISNIKNANQIAETIGKKGKRGGITVNINIQGEAA